MKYSGIIRRQHNAKLSGVEPEPVSADDYAQMLTDYINVGHGILKKQVEFFVSCWKEGNLDGA